MRGLAAILLGVLPGLQLAAAYWMEEVAHQGLSPFNPDPTYAVFRNVKDFGAVGDGVHDDTEAINQAISCGNRCAFGTCNGSTTTPAVVYLPGGTYLVSSSILDYYYTQIIGDPTDMPVIKGAASFPTNTSQGLIDGDKYQTNGQLSIAATNVFFRQVRNIVFDTTAIPATEAAIGIHWPSSQATSIQNCVFRLSAAPGTQHVGIAMEEGSGGFLGDLVFYGGKYGAQFGNQQYTTRNLTFIGAKTAIFQTWNWFWTYKSINIIDCEVGVNMSSTAVGSATFIDSVFTNVSLGIVTGRNPAANPDAPGQGTLVLENVLFQGVTTALEGTEGVIIAGNPAGQVYEQSYVIGNFYDPHGPYAWQNTNTDAYPAAQVLLQQDGKYYERAKPLYEDVPVGSFLSARSFGAAGNGEGDDSAALNALFAAAAAGWELGLVAFVDAGYYRVTDTVYIPPNTRIVGEALSSVIMGAGAAFEDAADPRPVVQVANPGDVGALEWSDMIVSTQGATAGAVLIRYNLHAPYNATGLAGDAAGMWDVHTRVGGFAGSQLQVAQCLKTPDETNVVKAGCIAAYLNMHITSCSGGLYMENNWLWTADHDIEDQNNTQISVFAGRGLLIESSAGPVWVTASGSEHHTLYQYQLAGAQNVYLGQIQSESPYYQPNPPAPAPFTAVDAALGDPDFGADCAPGAYNASGGAPCAMAWGLRVLDSLDVKVFGAGLYSFFNNYNTSCSDQGGGEVCQARVAQVRGSSAVELYDLATIGAVSMLTFDDDDVASYEDNVSGFSAVLALWQS